MITKDNYIEKIVDLADGTLSAEEQHQLYQMAEVDAEVGEALKMYLEASSLVLPCEKISEQKQLKKDIHKITDEKRRYTLKPYIAAAAVAASIALILSIFTDVKSVDEAIVPMQSSIIASGVSGDAKTEVKEGDSASKENSGFSERIKVLKEVVSFSKATKGKVVLTASDKNIEKKRSVSKKEEVLVASLDIASIDVLPISTIETAQNNGLNIAELTEVKNSRSANSEMLERISRRILRPIDELIPLRFIETERYKGVTLASITIYKKQK